MADTTPTVAERQYPHPEPRLWGPHLLLLLLPLCFCIAGVALRNIGGAYTISWWGWIEAIPVGIGLEIADLSFLVRWVATGKRGAQSRMAATGLAFAFIACVALSLRLATSVSHVESSDLYTALAASIGLNAVDFLLAYEIASQIVEFESEHKTWAEGKLRWMNQNSARAERRNAGIVRRSSRPVLPGTRAERMRTMLELYASSQVWGADDLMQRLNCGRTAAFTLRQHLVRTGQLVHTEDGYALSPDGQHD